LFLARIGLEFRFTPLREACMLVTKKNAPLKMFHATMVVTRLEEWCVEAETPEEARALLAAGQGHRCQLGDCVHVELEAMEDRAQ
jgi:hypothetical protein